MRKLAEEGGSTDDDIDTVDALRVGVNGYKMWVWY